MAVDRGHIDAFDEGTVMGWAVDSSDQFASVDIYLDDVFVGMAVADQYRADLKKVGIRSGCCGFRFYIPNAFLTGAEQRLSVRLSGTDHELIGSPVNIVGERPGGGASGLGKNLIINPALKHLVSPFGVIVGGANTLAEGVWIEASEKTVGVASYSCGHIDGFNFSQMGNVVPGVRLRAPVQGANIRLFFEMKVPRFVLVSPVTISFALNRQGPCAAPTIKISLGCINNRSLSLIWSQTVRRLAMGFQEISFPVPPAQINEIANRCAGGHSKPVAVFDVNGACDVTVSPFHLELGRGQLVEGDSGIYNFEDPVVRDQWTDIAASNLQRRATFQTDGDWVCHDLVNVPEIIVPIFNAPAAVGDCLSALRENTRTPHLVTLVNDGSFSDTSDLIERFSSSNPWCRVLRAAQNEGYTVAINKAIKSSVGKPLIILNSDTVVTPNWLPSLIECLHSCSNTGMAGPLSNAASWQSIPNVKNKDGWVINKLEANNTPEHCAAVLRSVSVKAFPEVPVLNGFCLAIRRELFDAIGLFDELSFPIGYGEENDFCMRATDAGFKLRVADHVYVYHHKSRSFGVERRTNMTIRANKILEARYGKERLLQLTTKMEACAALQEIRQKFAQVIHSPTP
jgi:GT2 family glycosyltransferase